MRRFSNQMRKFYQKSCQKRAKIGKSLQKCALFEQKLAEIHTFWTTFFYPPAQMRAPRVVVCVARYERDILRIYYKKNPDFVDFSLISISR